jgi:hypothetical protein
MTHRALIPALVVLALAAPMVSHANRSLPLSPHQLTGIADNIPIPPEWAGIWSYTDSLYDCGSSTASYTDTGFDTLCAGATYDPEDSSDVEITCTGTFTEDSANITCTGSYTVFEGCTAMFTITTSATRSGETFTSTSTFVTTYSPHKCAYVEDSCMIINEHATRIGPAPSDCLTATLPATWGAIKALYR